MSFTLLFDGIDLSPYVRVAPTDSMDPYGSGWQNPAFSEAAFAEGHPLLNVDVGNRELLFPLFVKGVGAAAIGDYSSTVLADTPALYWRLGETVGTGTAADTSGNGRTGTVGAGITLGVAGALTGDANTAASFNNTATAVITSTYNPFVAGSQRTFEAWVNRTDFSSTDVIWSGTGGSPPVLEGETAGQVSFYPDGSTPVTWAGVLAAGAYHHVVLTYNDTTKVAELFIDGVSVGTRTSTVNYGASPGNFQLGRGLGPFVGSLDEGAVYTGILSAARIAAHYTAGTTGGTPAVAAKDNLHALVQQINNAIRNPSSSPLRVEWKDSGASNSTFYDVTFARLEPHFNFRLSEHAYADLGLHIWCAPPYGHTATERVIATAAGTGVALTVPVASMAGDVPGLGKSTITEGSQALGRYIGVSVLPGPSYLPDFAAASMTLAAPATLVGGSGAAGSQVVQVASYGLGAKWCAVTLPIASAYVGRNRVFAVARSGVDPGVAITAHDALGNRIGPTAVASSRHAFQTLDLGVLTVPSPFLGPTSYQLQLRGGIVDPAAIPIPGGAYQAQINRLVVVPEDTTSLVRDNGSLKPLVADEFQRTGNLFGSYDALGNIWAADTYLSGAASVSVSTSNGGILSNVDIAHTGTVYAYYAALAGASVLNADVYGRFYTQASQVASAMFEVRKGPISARVGIGTAPYLAVVAASNDTGGKTQSNVGVLASVAIAGTSMPANLYRLELSTRENVVSANLIVDSPTAALIPAGTTTATSMIAATAVSATGLGPGQAGIGYAIASMGTGGGPAGNPLLEPRAIWGYSLPDAPASPLAGRDQYVLDSARGANYRISGAGGDYAGDMQANSIGPRIKIAPTAAAVCALSLPLDAQPTNDLLSVEVRVRERFSYAR